MSFLKRRNFLKLSGLSMLPAVLPLSAAKAATSLKPLANIKNQTVSFTDDGVFYEPAEYLSKLQEINASSPIEMDFYGGGGAVAKLCEKFADLTGKPASIYMPTGTMANQLAISVLAGENTKIFVQETSHIYRDEGDAAQSVFNKRLIPVATGEAYFTLDQLKEAIDYHNKGEVFKSGIGTVAIENPVRRCDGKYVPLEEIKKISAWCRENGYKLHMDGARVFLAMAVNGVSLKEYASYFDTVYISLYKYLGAAGGAVLCGDKETIGHMEHLIKIHGGTTFSNWSNAAMALHTLDGLEERLKQANTKADELFKNLNKMPGIKISAIPGGSNIFNIEITGTHTKIFNKVLQDKYQIVTHARNGVFQIRVNETLLRQSNSVIEKAFADALKTAKA
ncbi:aminotransferase class I/II-fold pyridoxal phosphate-dependent enzyme [Mucilaginibacter conchicola]|uniref:Aminotransferase class I/II-fold pyridoxal phosphate-dependent enzyme n=1 Tax=Mucilaginibacter conchicola TaxID=2303333 RepID=A0A372NY27_9SPHI|nr:aminotransferase class I/II-fold pyridoxal phosphate-dependent enzyme [Mucilaginibacter conchicola]RFZ94427.1 aminotransferase class I/II-fold pyridoxal phosphate-dependent enzyme [Mucilaginibacter conchicola]